MAASIGPKIYPCIWYAEDAEEAAAFYASIFPESKVNRVSTMPTETPSGPVGSVKIVDFTLFGQPFQAMTAGRHDEFNDAISLVVVCEDQEELDRYWGALLEGGGKEVMCGWLTDRYGVRWQIIPRRLEEMMASSDTVRGKRAADAMLKMVKIDIAELEKAWRG